MDEAQFQKEAEEYACAASLGRSNLAFDRLQITPPLCRLLVDEFCHRSDEAYWASNKEGEYPDSFLLTVLHRFTQKINLEEKWSQTDICVYHDHKNKKTETTCKWSVMVLEGLVCRFNVPSEGIGWPKAEVRNEAMAKQATVDIGPKNPLVHRSTIYTSRTALQ
ncbi:hypothetical protein K458DRAFT_382047 [Lentithecium fluviatile CBS 122367]|uniref:Uncharacterized protein n=1 Tax=Lentithecium fluviatile CBS 122367 TaxID=1168545 RepID=A0A6G1JPY4_9PLEO|nr:hypothetical protein K458DRAFT_382047 [Lentithecium fluviatile CBS 122367]